MDRYDVISTKVMPKSNAARSGCKILNTEGAFETSASAAQYFNVIWRQTTQRKASQRRLLDEQLLGQTSTIT